MAKDFAEIERMEAEAGLQATDGELTSEAKQSLTSRFVAQWEKKNARRAIRGGVVSTMALTLAACGDDDDDPDDSDPDTTPTAQTFTLTTSADTGKDFTGGDKGDTFKGELDAGNQTLNTFDVLDGGKGADTIDATITGTSTHTPTLTSIETVNLQFLGAATVSLDEAASVSAIKVHSSEVDTTVKDIEGSATLTLEDVIGSKTAQFVFANNALASDTADLTLKTDNTTATVDIDVGGDDAITTATIDSSGKASSLTIDALDNVKTLTVTGDAKLALVGANDFSAITSIKAGSFTGGLTMDLDDNAKAYEITLGSGADTITADQANTGTGGRTIALDAGDDTLDLGTLSSESDDVFTGGTGTDTLVIDDASKMTLAKTVGVSGFERLDAGEAASYDLAKLSNNSTITTLKADSTTDGSALAFTNVGAAVKTLELDASTANDGMTDAGDDVSLARLNDTSSDSLTVKVTDKAGVQLGDELIIDNEETVTIEADTGTLTLNTGLSADDMTSLTVTGDQNVDLSAVSSTKLETVDLSGLDDGDFTAEFTNATTNITVTANTTSSNSGKYDIKFGASDDTATGTSNADTFEGNGGDDTFTLGAGSDTVVIEASGLDTITDFATGSSGDVIKIDHSTVGTVIDGDGADTGGTAAVELVTGAETAGGTDNIFVLSGITFASAAKAGAALEDGGSRELTFGASLTKDEDFIFVYSDGTDAHVVAANIGTGTNAKAASGELSETTLVTLEGLDGSDLSTLTADNFTLA